MSHNESDREALHRCLDAIPTHIWDAATESDDVTGIIDAILADGFSRTTSPDAATELRTLPENGCDEQAHATMNRNINRVFENNVGLVNELDAMREERDAALAAIERVRALHYEEDHECAECSFEPMLDAGFRGVSVPWPCATIAALDGAPESATPELFPGTNAALDRLTVRKAADANAFCIEHDHFHAVELGDPTCQFEDGFGEPIGGEN